MTEIKPQAGPQERFLSCPADFVLYGGAAGGGKTWALLIEPLRHIHNADFGAVIFRRTNPQITAEGGLWDESHKIYPHLGGRPYYSPPLSWAFPSGAKITLTHMQHESNRLDWQGSQIPLICYDEVAHFTRQQFFYMLSRNRSTCGIRPYIRATCNPAPPGDKTGGWLHEFVDWYIDEEGWSIPERSGKVRWFVVVDDHLRWADTPDELRQTYPDSEPKSFSFIASSVFDNKILLRSDPGYLANLKALPLVERERLLGDAKRGGNWLIREQGGNIFSRDWFDIVGAAPVNARRVRYWDKAGTADSGDWSAGVLIARDNDGVYYVEDVVHGQWSALARERIIRQTAELDRANRGHVTTYVEQEPGSGGKESAEATIRNLAGFDVRAERVTGDKVTRAQPLSAQCEGRNVKLVRGAWTATFIDELTMFPNGAHDDQVDAAAGAFSKLATPAFVSPLVQAAAKVRV